MLGFFMCNTIEKMLTALVGFGTGQQKASLSILQRHLYNFLLTPFRLGEREREQTIFMFPGIYVSQGHIGRIPKKPRSAYCLKLLQFTKYTHAEIVKQRVITPSSMCITLKSALLIIAWKSLFKSSRTSKFYLC